MKLTHDDYLALESAMQTFLDLMARQREQGFVSDEDRAFTHEAEQITGAMMDFSAKYQSEETEYLALKGNLKKMMESNHPQAPLFMAMYPHIADEIEQEA